MQRRLISLILALYALLQLTSMVAAQIEVLGERKTIANYAIAKAIDTKLIANFPLDDVFLTKIENIRKDMENMIFEEEVTDADNDMTIKGMIRAVEARAHLVAILQKNQMTARDYVIGAVALADLLKALTQDDGDNPDTEHHVSAENLAFGKKYLERIRTLLYAAPDD